MYYPAVSGESRRNLTICSHDRRYLVTVPAAAGDENALNEIGICFMFAPLYHGATARVAGIRRQLGIHTTFNLLGPLSNPAGAPRQIIGVWHRELVEKLAQVLAALGTEHAWVVHGADGLDGGFEADAAGAQVFADGSGAVALVRAITWSGRTRGRPGPSRATLIAFITWMKRVQSLT